MTPRQPAVTPVAVRCQFPREHSREIGERSSFFMHLSVPGGVFYFL